jgi:echinoid protein
VLNYYSNVSQQAEDLYESVLTVSRVRSSSYGEYTCRALNTMGAARTAITMQPKGERHETCMFKQYVQNVDSL